VKFAGLGIALIGVGVLAGCATGARANASLTARFVKPGEPATDLGGPAPLTGQALRGQMKKVRQLVANTAPPRSTALGGRVENSDPRLAAALLLVAMAPSADHQLAVAQEYRRVGILDAAYDRAARAIEAEPRLAEAHEMQAKIWRDWGFPARALGAAYRAVSYAPKSVSARNTLGTVVESLGRYDDARRAFQAAADLDRSAAFPLNNLCHVELRVGRLDEARAQCEAALKRQPEFPAAHNNLALVFAASGDLVRAKQEFLLAGDVASAEYNIGIVYLADQQYGPAADSFEAAIKARPTFGAAKARAHEARVRAMSGGQ
jgi:tetratricopeptide (TPR) repeat protein